MPEITTGQIRLKRLSYAVSLAVASLAAANLAFAQDTQTTDKTAAKKDDGVVTVTVVGTRASQQSSIERKKNAATAMDSIVAADVGALPDRNIGEAISRIAGVALDRGEFGEGVNVSVRGNGPDLTRVEIDGQGVQSAGGTDMNGGGGGRGTEFRQLSSDLIKSVDVVKGSTADMTEGALGGGIIIKTRTGLDFKKPFVSVRVAGKRNSLNKEWEPDANVILANKYFNGRLGLLLNASTTTLNNESHSAQVATSANQGYARAIDFDNSPDKTFTYQPNTLDPSDPDSTTPTLRSPLKAGGTFDAATPQEILTKSAAAQSKQDCYNAFPALTSQQLSLMSSSSVAKAAQTQRGNELISCLNQWNDYTPSLIRYFVKRQKDKRQNLDLRADFKVNHELTVYAKGSYSKRRVDDNMLDLGFGGLSVNGTNSYVDAADGTRSAVPGSGYYLYDTPSWRSGNYPARGATANVDPSTVAVDANHHVTKFTITNGGANTDQIHNVMQSTSKYLQLGGAFHRGGLKAEFFVGDALSDFYRGDKRTNFSYNIGAETLRVLPNGLWTYDFPNGDPGQGNAANYATLYPATKNASKMPLTTTAPQITFSPRIGDSEERTAKLDLTYAMPESIPFFRRLKGGFNLRDTSNRSWGYGGYTVQSAQNGNPAIVVPTNAIRGHFYGCQDTAGSLAPGGTPCQYGYTPNTDPRYSQYGNTVFTPQQFQDIVAAAMTKPATNGRLFGGAANRPNGLIDNWTQIDVEKVFTMVGAPNINFDCVKRCKANDGKYYDQPVSYAKERTEAAYVMADFGLDHIPFTDRELPFGWDLEGNMGYRYVRTKVHGTGQMSFTSIVETASYDPANPTAPGGTVTSTYTKNATIDAVTHDFLPIYNLAMWLVPDQVVVRYNHAKTVARPPVSRLLPAGTCTYDQRNLDGSGTDQDQHCTTMGNPALRSQMNINQNLSIEYYPNKDTMFSAAVFKQEGIVGPAITQGVNGVPVFAGSNEVDPATGTALSDLRFDYRTYVNGPPLIRRGLELSTKTAFTFLPWRLRYTGFDANYTKVRSNNATQGLVDLLTGAPLPPIGEPKYSYNWALWYDDGKFAARLAVQAVATKFNCIAACGANTVNNYPNAGGGRTTVLPYNPGSPNFKDATRYIDGKISYKVTPSVELFVEGRNLGNATQTDSQAQFAPFADGTPNLLDYAYVGRSIMVGVNFRN
jgi:TonB-dependent receptor